jgi:5-(carboxyamino)imidazole ribonucleotide synthase
VLVAPATLGMLGGGQLGRFFVIAARELGYRTWVVDPDPASPAGAVADRHLVAAYDDPGALAELAAGCAAVTTEFENVPAPTLATLAESIVVHPSADAVAICQDRIAEKTFLQAFGCVPFAVIRDATDLGDVPDSLFPAILKTARLGYDGKGQIVVEQRAALDAAFDALGGTDAILEQKVPLDLELSVVLARGADGEVRAFPPAENRHVNGILDTSIVPAAVDDSLRDAAVALAGSVATALAYVGTLGVELFVSEGRLLVNEVAPRPHNSGHFTLDGSITNQFEQQVRALCGLPLGDPASHSATVMVNLLGDLWFDGDQPRVPDWAALTAIPELRLHLYGKAEPRQGRKMGHFTAVAPNRAAALAAANAGRRVVGLPVSDDA